MAESSGRILLNPQQSDSLSATIALRSLQEFCKDETVHQQMKNVTVTDLDAAIQHAFSLFSVKRDPSHFQVSESKILLMDDTSEFARGYRLAQKILTNTVPGHLRLDNSYWSNLVKTTQAMQRILGQDAIARVGESRDGRSPILFNSSVRVPIPRTGPRGLTFDRSPIVELGNSLGTKVATDVSAWSSFLSTFTPLLETHYRPILALLTEYGENAFETIPYGYKPNHDAISWMAQNLSTFDRSDRPTLRDLMEIFFDEMDQEVPAFGSISLEALIGHQPIIYIEKSLAETPQGKEIIAAFNRMSEESRVAQEVRKSPRKEALRRQAAAEAGTAPAPEPASELALEATSAEPTSAEPSAPAPAATKTPTPKKRLSLRKEPEPTPVEAEPAPESTPAPTARLVRVEPAPAPTARLVRDE